MNDSMNTFDSYEERFDRLIGQISAGQYGQFRGRLVRRMTGAEYKDELNRYLALGQRLENLMDSGDTMDERLTTQIRALEVTLVLEKSQILPEF